METINETTMKDNIEKLNTQMVGLVINEELLKNDERYLLPITKDGKIGMINHNAEIVIPTIYDKIPTNCFSETDYICVWQGKKKGVFNGNGEEILPVIYDHIRFGHGSDVFSVEKDYKHAVVNAKNEYIVEPGIYDYIDGFEKGYARVKIGKEPSNFKNNSNQWGLINEKGEVVLPIEYESIWNFYGKDYSTIVLEKDGKKEYIRFDALQHTEEDEMDDSFSYGNDDYDYPHYGEYAGTYAQDYAGYDDDTISDAFDGDPDAYWNID